MFYPFFRDDPAEKSSVNGPRSISSVAVHPPPATKPKHPPAAPGLLGRDAQQPQSLGMSLGYIFGNFGGRFR